MTADRGIRASDQDREHIVEILRAQYAEGRLTLAEFDERMAAAFAAKTWGDLRDLTNDLPADVRLGGDLAATPNAGPPGQPANPRPPALHLLRFAPLAPLLLAAVVLSSLAWDGPGYPGHHHGHFVILPVWLLVVAVIFLRRGMYRHRGGRGGPFR